MSGNPVNSSNAKNLIKHTQWSVPTKESKFKHINILDEKKRQQTFSSRKVLMAESNERRTLRSEKIFGN